MYAIGSHSASRAANSRRCSSGGRHACRKLKRAEILLGADARVGNEEIARSGLTVCRTSGRQSGTGAERRASSRSGTQAHRQGRSLAGGDRLRGPSKGSCSLDARSAGGCARQAHHTKEACRARRSSDAWRRMTSNPGARTCGVFRRSTANTSTRTYSISCGGTRSKQAGGALRRKPRATHWRGPSANSAKAGPARTLRLRMLSQNHCEKALAAMPGRSPAIADLRPRVLCNMRRHVHSA